MRQQPVAQISEDVLNQAVKRNLERFPEDFMFQLTKEEFENWKSQFVASKSIIEIPMSKELLAMVKPMKKVVNGDL